MRSWLRSACRAGGDAAHAFIIALLILQLALPTPLYAPDGNEPGGTSQTAPQDPPALAAAQQAAEREGRNARLRLTPEERNLYFLIGQTLSTSNGNQSWNLAQLQLGAPEFNIAPGSAARLLNVTPVAGGIQLSLTGYSYTHKINLDGREVTSIVHDREYLLMHTKTGEWLAVDMRLLEQTIYRAPIQVISLAKTEPIEGIDLSKVRLRIIQRRYSDLDQSRGGREAQLDRRASTVTRVIALADATFVERLEANFDKVRYIPLDPAIAEQHKLLQAGDIAMVVGEGDSERIIRVIPQTRVASDVKEHVKLGHGLSVIANPDWAEAQKEFSSIRDEVAADVNEVVKNRALAEWFLVSGHRDAFGRIPREAFAAAEAHSKQVEESAAGRDQFTPHEHRQDSQYLGEVLDLAHQAAAENKSPRWMRRWALWMGERVRKMDVPAAYRRLGYTLAVGGALTGAVAVDMVAGTGLTMDLVASVSHWTQTKFPVWFHADYTPILLASVGCQMLLPLLLYGAAALVSPFTQYRTGVLLPLTTIRLYARYLQSNPLRLIAWITGQGPTLQALREGGAAAPVLPIPGETRRAQIARRSESLRRAQEKGAIYTLALAAVALKERIHVGRLAVAAEGRDPESRAGQSDSIELATEIEESMKDMTKEEVEKLVRENADALLEHIRRLRGVVDPLSAPAARERWWNKMGWYACSVVKVRALKLFGNYSESVRKDLGNIVPNDFVTGTVNREYWIDYTLSLLTAASMGDWAKLNEPNKLHAQRDEFLYTSRLASSENVQQTGIHLGRGAAGTALTFERESNSTNAGYGPAESVDEAELQKTATRGLAREYYDFVKLLFDFRNVQPGEIAMRMIYNGRIRLFQSTLLLGVVPRLVFGGQTLEAAVIGQGVFMACALWAFGWPWVLIHGAQDLHQDRIKEKWTEFRSLQVRLNQAWRLRDEEGSRKVVAEMQDFLRNKRELGNAKDEPIRGEKETAVQFAKRLHDHGLEHPPVPSRHSSLVAATFAVSGGIATGVMATYFFTKTFMGGIGWLGFNPTNWNLFGNLPNGDGLLALSFKAAVLLHVFVLGQRLFNVGWDYMRLQWALDPIARHAARERLAESAKAVAQAALVRYPVAAARAVAAGVGGVCSLVTGAARTAP